LSRAGSTGFSLSTPDDQFSVQFANSLVVPEDNEAYYVVRVTPLDPASLGQPPGGGSVDGNAYRVEATYRNSRRPIRLTASSCEAKGPIARCPVMVLRFAARATKLYRVTDSRWIEVPARLVAESRSFIFASLGLGTFVAVEV
jgi:hypothetical protein